MKLYIVLALTLMMSLMGSLAERSKGRKAFILPSGLKLRQTDIEQLLQNQNGYENENDEDSSDFMGAVPSAVALKPDSSRGRLFFKKFFNLNKQQSTKPQIIIISRPTLATTGTLGSGTTGTGSGNQTFQVITEGTETVSPASREGAAFDEDDYADDDDDEYVDDIPNEKPNPTKKQQQPGIYKLVKSKGNPNNQQRLSLVVPSKYMRNLQNNRNTFVVNPSGNYNNNGGGASKMKKFRLSINGNGNVKRIRSRTPSAATVHRRFVQQN